MYPRVILSSAAAWRLLMYCMVAGLIGVVQLGRLNEPAPLEARAAVRSPINTLPFATRSAHDPARQRWWALNGDTIDLYDTLTGQIAARYALPGWSYVDEPDSCEPGMAIDGTGRLIVSSNVDAALWRIDPQSGSVVKIGLALDTDSYKEVGFSALVVDGPEHLLAASAIHGSLWRIDLAAQKAVKLALPTPLHGACALAWSMPPHTKLRGAAEPAGKSLCVSAWSSSIELALDSHSMQAMPTGTPCRPESQRVINMLRRGEAHA